MPVEEKKALKREIRRLEAEKESIEEMGKRNAEDLADQHLLMQKASSELDSKLIKKLERDLDEVKLSFQEKFDEQKEIYEDLVLSKKAKFEKVVEDLRTS